MAKTDEPTTEITTSRHSGLVPWKPGQSGNPKGRPKGAKQEFGEAFVKALHEDFEANGAGVIAKVRTEKPDVYLKVCATVCPREITVTTDDHDSATVEQLLERITQIDGAIERALGAKLAARTKASDDEASPVSAVH